ncbi:MAG: ABC transporter permease [Candidatus Kapabacteria bacterium]|nr:ABC transporter permease [Candidatus Kapabacteria bacterium]
MSNTTTTQAVSESQSETYGQFVRRQFKKNTMGMVSLYVVFGLAFIALFADFLANEKPIIASYQGGVSTPVLKGYAVSLGLMQWTTEETQRDWKTVTYDWVISAPIPYTMESVDKTAISLKDRAPSSRHWFGTDDIGRDICAGIIHGTRYALSIGFIAISIALAIGVVLGLIAGYYGGWVDILISRIIEIVISLPTFFLIITIVAMLQDTVREGRIFLIMSVIGLTSWTSIARLVRGEVLRVKTMEYVTASKALGFSSMRILFGHVLPNSIAPVLVSAAFGIATGVLIESSLSFLGFGVPPTVITWGSMLFRVKASINAWWVGLYPGIMIFLTVSAYNLIGDALRDATDPRLRQ